MARTQDIVTRRAIGRNLQAARNLAGLSQVQVMTAIWREKNPKQKNRISEIESGQTLPDAELLQQLVKLYGVSADYILGLSVEPEIDETAGRVGYIYNGVKEIVGEAIQSFSERITIASSNYIKAMPKPHMIALLDQAKRVLSNTNEIELKKLASMVRDTEVQLAVQMRGFETALSELIERPDVADKHNLSSDTVDKSIQRFRTTCLPSKESQKPKPTSQHSLFTATSGECIANPLSMNGG